MNFWFKIARIITTDNLLNAMNQEVSIFKSKPILFSSLSLLVLFSCSYHLLNRFGFDLSVLIGLAASVFFLSLGKEIKIFLIGSLKNPGENFLILCILFFSFFGILFIFENTVEIGLFVILFFGYRKFKNKRKIWFLIIFFFCWIVFV